MFKQARSNPELRASANQGKPPIAATAKAGDFHGSAVPAKEAGAPYKAPERTAATNENRPANANEAHANNYNHATEVQSHQYKAPSTGNAATDKKYQQQQDKLAAKQNQEHQKLQQQQEKEHQQMAKKNASDAQKQQMEQRHTQQTQQLEQKHTATAAESADSSESTTAEPWLLAKALRPQLPSERSTMPARKLERAYVFLESQVRR